MATGNGKWDVWCKGCNKVIEFRIKKGAKTPYEENDWETCPNGHTLRSNLNHQELSQTKGE